MKGKCGTSITYSKSPEFFAIKVKWIWTVHALEDAKKNPPIFSSLKKISSNYFQVKSIHYFLCNCLAISFCVIACPIPHLSFSLQAFIWQLFSLSRILSDPSIFRFPRRLLYNSCSLFPTNVYLESEGLLGGRKERTTIKKMKRGEEDNYTKEIARQSQGKEWTVDWLDVRNE